MRPRADKVLHERRKKTRHKSIQTGESDRVTLLNVPGVDGKVQAKVLDTNESGLGGRDGLRARTRYAPWSWCKDSSGSDGAESKVPAPA